MTDHLPDPKMPTPDWYEHCLLNERGVEVSTILADHAGPVFGKPDVDYDKTFTVRVVPLYKIKPAKLPDKAEYVRGDGNSWNNQWKNGYNTCLTDIAKLNLYQVSNKEPRND